MGELEFLKFLLENFGIIATIAVVVMIFPFAVAVAMWRLAVKSQNQVNEELKEILENEKELTGLVNGTLSIVKLFIGEKFSQSIDEQKNGKED